MILTLDHIAVAGETLEEAAAHCEAALGVAMLPGGHHERFGTHNQLQGLADDLYIEAIAIDPAAPKPPTARWFGLDGFSGPPRLGSWVCNVPNLDAALAALPEAGRAHDVRRGALAWRISVPESGVTAFDGLFPTLIEWKTPVPPGKSLPSCGVALARLELTHPDAAALQQRLAGHLEDPRVGFEVSERCGLTAYLETAQGPRVLQ